MSDGGVDITVIAGSPTDEETAAIAAVFTQLLLERSVSAEQLPPDPRRTLWSRTMRPIRTAAATDAAWR